MYKWLLRYNLLVIFVSWSRAHLLTIRTSCWAISGFWYTKITPWALFIICSGRASSLGFTKVENKYLVYSLKYLIKVYFFYKTTTGKPRKRNNTRSAANAFHLRGLLHLQGSILFLKMLFVCHNFSSVNFLGNFTQKYTNF